MNSQNPHQSEKSQHAASSSVQPSPSLQDAREDLSWEEIRREHIIQDEWIDFRRSAYRFPDGSVWEPYYTYSRRDYVVMVASDEEGRFLCVRQFRQGIGQVTTEFPAGCMERGELPLDAAIRELREETGYVSEEWTHLLSIPANATLADHYAHIFLAENCRKQTGQDLDPMEFLNVELHTAEEIEALIRTGGFPQAVHVMAWLLAGRIRT